MSSRKLDISVWNTDKNLGGTGIYGIVEARYKSELQLGEIIAGYLYRVRHYRAWNRIIYQ